MVRLIKTILIVIACNCMLAKYAFAANRLMNRIVNDTVQQSNANFTQRDNIFEVGYAIPSFEGKSADGKKISFADYKGKIVVINFWFVYCTPCLAEMPVLNAVKKMANADEVAFLSITYDSAELVNNLHKLRPFDFDKIVEAKALVEQFKITGYPRTIVVDKNGIVQYIFRGGIHKATDLQDAILRVQKNQ